MKKTAIFLLLVIVLLLTIPFTCKGQYNYNWYYIQDGVEMYSGKIINMSDKDIHLIKESINSELSNLVKCNTSILLQRRTSKISKNTCYILINGKTKSRKNEKPSININ